MKNFLRDNDDFLFQFDTGASLSLIGLNSICEDDEQNKQVLKEIIINHIKKERILAHKGTLKTVTEETMEVYPCKLAGVSIMGTMPITFYFHIYLGNISIPLIGYDYIDDCTYYHKAGGRLEVISIADNVGKRFYLENVLDFNNILEEYYKKIE